MKQTLFILAAIALLGQFNDAVAQTAATQGQITDQFFTTVIRSSVAYKASAEQATMRRCCEKIEKDIQRVYFLQNRNGKMKVQVKGVYTHGASIFFRMQFNNRSPLDYEVDSICFLITATGKSKGPSGHPGAGQPSRSLQPVYIYDSTAVIPGYGRAASIFVLPRFTLSAGQQLLIEVQEKNGGRHLQLQATNWTLERARLI